MCGLRSGRSERLMRGATPTSELCRTAGRPHRSALRRAGKWKREDGEAIESAEWHRIAVHGAAAKAAEDMVRKGSAVLVEGSLALREYKDKQGNARQVAEVVPAGREGMLNVLTRNAENAIPKETAAGAGGGRAAARDQEQ